MFPIKYIDNNLVWNKDNEVFAYYELIPYNYSFLSAEQKFIVHDNIVNIIFTKNVNLKITRNVNLLLPVLLTYVYLFRPFLVFQHIHKILGSI